MKSRISNHKNQSIKSISQVSGTKKYTIPKPKYFKQAYSACYLFGSWCLVLGILFAYL
jgi:hypothetical protein